MVRGHCQRKTFHPASRTDQWTDGRTDTQSSACNNSWGDDSNVDVTLKRIENWFLAVGWRTSNVEY